MSFRENLKAELEFQGMIVKELAARSHISKRTLDTYLDSRAVLPNVVAAYKIARVLNVSVEYLVSGIEDSLQTPHSQYTKYKDILDDITVIPQDIFLPIRAAIKTAADAERKKKGKKTKTTAEYPHGSL